MNRWPPTYWPGQIVYHKRKKHPDLRCRVVAHVESIKECILYKVEYESCRGFKNYKIVGEKNLRIGER